MNKDYIQANYPVYPEIEIIEKAHTHPDVGERKIISFATTVRKEHEGKWYLWDHYKRQEFDPQEYEEGKVRFLKQMYKEVYFTIVLGVVQPEIRSFEGLVFSSDPNNENETDRLKNTYPHLK